VSHRPLQGGGWDGAARGAAIRIVLVDDQALFREGLRTLLSVRPGMEVVGEAANGEEALRVAALVRPHVVLVDLRMPVLDGVATTRRLRAALPETRVIVLTTYDDDEYVFEGLRAGASGYLLKDVSSERLVEAIHAVARGESFLQPSVAAKVVAEFARLGGGGTGAGAPPASSMPPLPVGGAQQRAQPLAEPLSPRELELLRLVAAGASNREVAAALSITEGTAKNHVSSILGKLGVRDRTQAALRARDLGLL
jgi:DNA-binding NarL/FixJ family response regulator